MVLVVTMVDPLRGLALAWCSPATVSWSLVVTIAERLWMCSREGTCSLPGSCRAVWPMLTVDYAAMPLLQNRQDGTVQLRR